MARINFGDLVYLDRDPTPYIYIGFAADGVAIRHVDGRSISCQLSQLETFQEYTERLAAPAAPRVVLDWFGQPIEPRG